MDIRTLVKLASAAYPDDRVAYALSGEDDKHGTPKLKPAREIGDGLAEFIAREIVETFSGETVQEQLEEAARAMRSAAREIEAVAARLENLASIAKSPKEKLTALVGHQDPDLALVASEILKE